MPSLKKPDRAGFHEEPKSSFLADSRPPGLTNQNRREKTVFMADTSKLSKDERKKIKRAARKKRKAEKPLAKRDYARGSKKSKVKKMVRGQSKRG
jgi:hypothetical protein